MALSEKKDAEANKEEELKECAEIYEYVKCEWFGKTKAEARGCREKILNDPSRATGDLTDDETYWFIGAGENVRLMYFLDFSLEPLADFKNGWCFRTKAEAEANKERVLAEYANVMNESTK